MMIPDEVIEQVRDAADITQILGEHVALKRTGTDYRGPCPFHGGTHRNFAVIPKKQLYYCFVCHEAGDIFTFFMKRLGMDYPTAVREVARRVGIAIPERPSGGPDPREPLYEAIAVAAQWYAERLREGSDGEAARGYLAERGFSLDALLPHGLGFSPKGDAFLAAMRRLGISDEILLEAGLAVRREDNTLRPRFWGRLLFPIHDLRGRIVGFGGRVIGEGEPKYLNSPESPVFHKGKLLYNLHDAKPAIRQSGRAILVEGYFDVLRLVEAGVEHVVAPLGTALTAEQAPLLRRFTADVTVMYDSDRAGLRATFRAGDELLRAGVRVNVATLPSGEDPDTLVKAGGREAIERILDDAIDVCERKIQLLERKGWLGSLSGRRKALDRMIPTLRAASDPITAELYISRTAEALGISRESVAREVDRHGVTVRPVRVESAEAPAPRRHGPLPEHDLIRVMLRDGEWRQRIAEMLRGVTQLEEPEGTILRRLAESPSLSGQDLLAELDAEGRALLIGLLERPLREGFNVDAHADGALARLQRRPYDEEIDRLQKEMLFDDESKKLEKNQRIKSLAEKSAQLNAPRWNVIRQRGSGAI